MMRRAAAGFLVVVVCLLVPLAVAGLWARDRFLDTDGWVELTAELPDDPEAREAVAIELTDVVLDGLGVSTKVRRQAEPVVREAADRALVSETFAEVWTDANRELHARLVEVLEADEGSAARLDLRPSLAIVLDTVEEPIAAVHPLPGDVPELSASPTTAEAEAAIEAALGHPLDPTRATVAVLRDDRIGVARSVYRGVDSGAFLLALATVVLGVIAIALSSSRWKTGAALGLGSAVTLAIGWVAAQGIGSVSGGFLGEGLGRAVAEAAAALAADDLGSRYLVTAAVLGALGLASALVGAVRSRAA